VPRLNELWERVFELFAKEVTYFYAGGLPVGNMSAGRKGRRRGMRKRTLGVGLVQVVDKRFGARAGVQEAVLVEERLGRDEIISSNKRTKNK
jgi:hypothetical protein